MHFAQGTKSRSYSQLASPNFWVADFATHVASFLSSFLASFLKKKTPHVHFKEEDRTTLCASQATDRCPFPAPAVLGEELSSPQFAVPPSLPQKKLLCHLAEPAVRLRGRNEIAPG